MLGKGHRYSVFLISRGKMKIIILKKVYYVLHFYHQFATVRGKKKSEHCGTISKLRLSVVCTIMKCTIMNNFKQRYIDRQIDIILYFSDVMLSSLSAVTYRNTTFWCHWLKGQKPETFSYKKNSVNILLKFITSAE